MGKDTASPTQPAAVHSRTDVESQSVDTDVAPAAAATLSDQSPRNEEGAPATMSDDDARPASHAELSSTTTEASAAVAVTEAADWADPAPCPLSTSVEIATKNAAGKQLYHVTVNVPEDGDASALWRDTGSATLVQRRESELRLLHLYILVFHPAVLPASLGDKSVADSLGVWWGDASTIAARRAGLARFVESIGESRVILGTSDPRVVAFLRLPRDRVSEAVPDSGMDPEQHRHRYRAQRWSAKTLSNRTFEEWHAETVRVVNDRVWRLYAAPACDASPVVVTVSAIEAAVRGGADALLSLITSEHRSSADWWAEHSPEFATLLRLQKRWEHRRSLIDERSQQWSALAANATSKTRPTLENARSALRELAHMRQRHDGVIQTVQFHLTALTGMLDTFSGTAEGEARLLHTFQATLPELRDKLARPLAAVDRRLSSELQAFLNGPLDPAGWQRGAGGRRDSEGGAAAAAAPTSSAEADGFEEV